MKNRFRDRIFSISNQSEFTSAALDIFSCQSEKNPVYRAFIENLGRSGKTPGELTDIPFLPVEFFRNHIIVTGHFPVQMIFESSGTAGMIPGRHFVKDLAIYEDSFIRAFKLFYGDPKDYLVLALLPSYTDRRGSSLVYMVDKLIGLSRYEESGFYRENFRDLLNTISEKEKFPRKLIIGVSFAMLDLAIQHSPDLSGFVVMETGGMKGRRKELTREELHLTLKEKFNVPAIHSEYGMTELLSQAYSAGDGIFYCPPWMKVLIRDPQDPLTIIKEPGRTGGINIIDLANMNSVSFIATGDLGRLHADGGFEVLGRFDNSDIRGCNLMTE